jgi:hypothetical protein
MTKPLTHLDLARRDAQELHKKISANIALAEKATMADVQKLQADASALAAKMKESAAGQADAIQAGVKAAIAKLDAGATMMKGKVAAGKEDIQQANAALLAASHNAAISLSHAVADMRTKAAKAIEPKKVHA